MSVGGPETRAGRLKREPEKEWLKEFIKRLPGARSWEPEPDLFRREPESE